MTDPSRLLDPGISIMHAGDATLDVDEKRAILSSYHRIGV